MKGLGGEMLSSCRIAIVGGGLAGLAVANALKTFAIDAEVFEQAPALGEIGAAVKHQPASRQGTARDRGRGQNRRCRAPLPRNLHAQYADRRVSGIHRSTQDRGAVRRALLLPSPCRSA